MRPSCRHQAGGALGSDGERVRRRLHPARDEPPAGARLLNADSSPTVATPTTYALTMNAVRRVMRHAMDSGAAATAQLPREFIVTLPFGGALSHRNPRPFSDPVLRELSDPANIRLLDERDPHDGGFADIWSIQVRCGRRIGEVVKLRFDCVSEHLGR